MKDDSDALSQNSKRGPLESKMAENAAALIQLAADRDEFNAAFIALVQSPGAALGLARICDHLYEIGTDMVNLYPAGTLGTAETLTIRKLGAALRRFHLGADTAEYAQAQYGIAMELEELGLLDEAEQRCRQAIEIRKRHSDDGFTSLKVMKASLRNIRRANG